MYITYDCKTRYCVGTHFCDFLKINNFRDFFLRIVISIKGQIIPCSLESQVVRRQLAVNKLTLFKFHVKYVGKSANLAYQILKTRASQNNLL